jgi:hypothetical protein
MARNGEVAIVDMDGRERASHRIPYGAHLMSMTVIRSRATGSPNGIRS